VIKQTKFDFQVADRNAKIFNLYFFLILRIIHFLSIHKLGTYFSIGNFSAGQGFTLSLSTLYNLIIVFGCKFTNLIIKH